LEVETDPVAVPVERRDPFLAVEKFGLLLGLLYISRGIPDL
jgi:hypothetical protein